MGNQEDRFAKNNSEAIKSLVSRAVPGYKNTHTQNMQSLKVWLSSHNVVHSGLEQRVINYINPFLACWYMGGYNVLVYEKI